jgi:hypothetical protein
MQRASISLALGLVALVALAAPSTARADRSFYVGFGAGFYNDFDCCHIHGRVQGDIGWHFDGRDTGFFLEIDPIITFGPDYFMFTGGLRLGGDIQVHHDRHFDLLLRPSGLVGIGVRAYGYHPFGDTRDTFGNFTLQPAFDVRFVLADGLIALWARPLAFDLMFWWDRAGDKSFAFSAAYQFLAGIDFQF